MGTQAGHLVLADISGYTKFVAETELEHSREILNELLETLVRGLAEHLRIGQIEGDAIFALGETVPDQPGEWLEGIFLRFHRHLNAIKRVSTCPCKACVSVGSLTLKFICHWGEYLPQSFLGKETFVGNAVNQVHRLLKNGVPSREYLLATKETLDHFPAEMRGRFTPHVETYDLGVVECGWIDLAHLRNDPRTDEVVKVVDDAHAIVRSEIVLDAPMERIWDVITDPRARREWMGVERMDYEPGARGTMVGGEYHCYHGQGEEAIFRIMEARRPAQMTMVMQFGPAVMWNTVVLEPVDLSRTRVISRYHVEPPEGMTEFEAFARQLLDDYEKRYAVGLRDLVERGAEAKAPA